MSEITGKEVINAMRDIVDKMDGPRLMFRDEIEALLSYLYALEEEHEAVRPVVPCLEEWPIEDSCHQGDESVGIYPCEACGVLLEAFNKVEGESKPLPTFEDVKGILADKEMG